MQALSGAHAVTGPGCRFAIASRSPIVAPLERRRQALAVPAAPRPQQPRRQQQPQHQQQRRAVVTHAMVSAETLVGLAIFFSPSVAALVYAYIKGKGNLADGLSRLLTDVSQVGPLGCTAVFVERLTQVV